jgi:hypothetical protein
MKKYIRPILTEPRYGTGPKFGGRNMSVGDVIENINIYTSCILPQLLLLV